MSTSAKPEQFPVRKTPLFLASYAHLLRPNPKWLADSRPSKRKEVSAVWDPSKFTDKDKARWAEITGDLLGACRKHFPEVKFADGDLDDCIVKMRMANLRFAIHFGNEKPEYGEGLYFANLSKQANPKPGQRIEDVPDPRVDVVASYKDPVTDKWVRLDDESCYSGMYGVASVSVYVNTKASKGVMLGLNNFQKIRDGVRLAGGGARAEADFDDADMDDEWLTGAGDDALS